MSWFEQGTWQGIKEDQLLVFPVVLYSFRLLCVAEDTGFKKFCLIKI